MIDPDDAAKLADEISDRVFAEMSKFVEVLENLTRENEDLRARVETLELMVFEDEDELDDSPPTVEELADLPWEVDGFFDLGDAELDQADDDADAPLYD